MPTISVIIPTYNRRPLLAEAVESVLAQSHADLELIIVDDGSTDDTDTYLQSVRLSDARVKPIYKSHIGNISRVFNVGVETAQGDWIAFLGSDDLWLPNKLKRQLDALSNAPECRWCYSDFTTIDEGGRPILRPSGKPFHPYSGWITHQLITFDATVASQTCLIAHDLLTQAGPFDPDVIHGQDYELLLRISLKGQAVPLNEALACVREHAQRTTKSRKYPYEQVFAIFDKTFNETLDSSSDAKVKVLCRQQCAVALIQAANYAATRQEPRRAMSLLRQALHYRPSPSQWTWCLVKSLLKRIRHSVVG